jgi:hypothetical protein
MLLRIIIALASVFGLLLPATLCHHGLRMLVVPTVAGCRAIPSRRHFLKLTSRARKICVRLSSCGY